MSRSHIRLLTTDEIYNQHSMNSLLFPSPILICIYKCMKHELQTHIDSVKIHIFSQAPKLIVLPKKKSL